MDYSERQIICKWQAWGQALRAYSEGPRSAPKLPFLRVTMSCAGAAHAYMSEVTDIAICRHQVLEEGGRCASVEGRQHAS